MHRNSTAVSPDFSRHAPMFAAVALALAAANVQAQTLTDKAANNASVWEASVGIAVVSAPEWEGAKRRVSGLAPDLNLSYKTGDWGTLSIGSRSQGLAWTFVESKDHSIGVALSSDSGRRAGSEGTVFRPGSKRLSGMGDIKSSADFAVFGRATLGLPIGLTTGLRYTRNLGDGKVSATNFSQDGHGGSKLELNVELPYQVSPSLSVYASPSLTWADKTYTLAYFGVTPTQAVRSGLQAFTAGSGVKDVSLNLGAQLSLDKQWRASVNLGFGSLRGDAAKSSIVEKKSSNSLAVGLSHAF